MRKNFQQEIDDLTALLVSAICARYPDRVRRLAEVIRVQDRLAEAVAEAPYQLTEAPAPQPSPEVAHR